MLAALGFPKPPANITPAQLFSKVIGKVNRVFGPKIFSYKVLIQVKENMAKIPKEKLSEPLFTGILSEKQWQTLKNINEAMTDEYKWREDVLLKRVDVTLQSFTWSDRIKVCRIDFSDFKNDYIVSEI